MLRQKSAVKMYTEAKHKMHKFNLSLECLIVIDIFERDNLTQKISESSCERSKLLISSPLFWIIIYASATISS